MPPTSLSVKFYERTSGNDWVSDPITTGLFSVEVKSPKPGYIQIIPYGNCIEVVGRTYSGWAGVWPILVLVKEAGGGEFFLTINLEILPYWQMNEDAVTPDDEALGDFYYELSGGPLRKEYQWAS